MRRRRNWRRPCAATSLPSSRCGRRKSSPRCAKPSQPQSRAARPISGPTACGGTDYCMLMPFHAQTPLRRVEEMRADFVANASHELRTPLAALSGFIDTLQGPAKDDAKARERFLGIMHAQATRMARLIDDLLSLSRVELSAHVRP